MSHELLLNWADATGAQAAATGRRLRLGKGFLTRTMRVVSVVGSVTAALKMVGEMKPGKRRKVVLVGGPPRSADGVARALAIADRDGVYVSSAAARRAESLLLELEDGMVSAGLIPLLANNQQRVS